MIDGLPAEEVSIGDYVLAGGELPALVLIEAVTRLLPGVIGSDESHARDSFSEPGLLDHPHYTRPQEFRGMRVPDVLDLGDHAAIEAWRVEARARQDPAQSPRSVELRSVPARDARQRTATRAPGARWYNRQPLP